MPRGHLNEKYVQEVAVEQLANYYEKRLKTQAIVSVTEAIIGKASPLGSGRADGLITMLLSDESIYVASVEAKSSRTWDNIKINYRDAKLLFHTALVGAIVCLLAVLIGSSLSNDWIWRLAFPIFAFVVAGVAFFFFGLTYGISIYQPIDVIEQAKRYPANEQWIALPTDSYNKLKQEKLDHDFRYMCGRAGIGLIRVSPGRKAEIVLSSKPQTAPKTVDSFLDCYAKARSIRSKIDELILEGKMIANSLILSDIE